MGGWLEVLSGQRMKVSAQGTFLLPEQEQLNKYADAFYGLARLFQEMPCQKEYMGDEGLREVFREVQEAVCRRCGREEQCWGNAYFESCRMLYEMAAAAQEEGISGRMVREASGQCGRADLVAETVTAGCARVRRELLWKNRMLELRTAVGEQIYQTAELMKRTAEGFEEVTEFQKGYWKTLRRNLGYLHVKLEGLRVFRCGNERTEIFMTLRAEKNVCVSAGTVAEILSESCRTPMSPARDCQAAVLRESRNFHFVPDTRYQLLCGISNMTRAGELVSGDNFAFLQKETGQVVMSLADGMGSGVKACKESGKVLDLLELFLEAGFPQETAVRMINSCMLLQEQSQVFSTIDLCMVDLYHADCDMIKSGAAPSFLKHGEEIEMIRAETFPSGVLWQSDYESLHRQLASGDVIIMMTDGVFEALPEEQREEQMKELIRKASCPNAKEFARGIIERVYLMQKLAPQDDMTVLVGSILEKS
ncbi:MAG: SpoIIE family protein phosphatase [Lachnospiraceae bacterium]|nr:SpoIIE family protein phosphatase [Lachnospiraceae bacterium]